MKMRSLLGLAGIVAAVVILAPACSSDDTGDDAIGLDGSAGSGGAAGSAGAAGSSAAGAAGAAGSGGAADTADTAGAAGSGVAGAQDGALSFAGDVLPILRADCGDCHAYFLPFASDDPQESYEVATEQTSYDGMDQPRYDVIVARALDGSMPPQCGGGAPGSSTDCITEQDLQIIRDWVDSGDPPPH